MKPISPEITRTKKGSATALAESPRNPDVLWVGTDDGAIWVTRDGGAKWARVDEKVGLPGPRWVATLEASREVEGRCYAAFDAHRSDDDEPYVYVTEDFGQTWKSLRGNLPAGSTRVLREDMKNPNVLYLGTEFAAWASVNRGASWARINNNLPTVAVHEFAQHPLTGEVIAATHGRSVWILDASALRQIKPETLAAAAHLFEPVTATRWRPEPSRDSPYSKSARRFVGTNPPRGAAVYYSFAKKPEKASLKVVDYTGTSIRELPMKLEPGLHRVVWDLTRLSARPAIGLATGEVPPETILDRQGGLFSASVAPGMYRVVLSADGKDISQPLRVEADPVIGANAMATEGEEEDGEKEP